MFVNNANKNKQFTNKLYFAVWKGRKLIEEPTGVYGSDLKVCRQEAIEAARELTKLIASAHRTQPRSKGTTANISS